jgi:hypothetical protein
MQPERALKGTQCDFLAARLRITPALEVRVLAQNFGDGCYVHVREFALTNENEFVATPRGITVPLDALEGLLDGIRELRGAGDHEGLVATLPLSGGREVRFTVSKWQGITKADLRQFFKNASSNETLPTKKGIRINLALLPELERGVEVLDRHLGN